MGEIEMIMESTRRRGIIAVRADGDRQGVSRVLAELQAGFEGFKAQHNSRVDGLERGLEDVSRAVDDMSRGMAAIQVGPHGGSDPRRRDSAKALVSLGDFARTGDISALGGGMKVNAAMKTGSGPDGGFTVPEELAGEIVSVQKNTSAMRQLARVITTTAGTFEQPVNRGGAGSGWTNEGAARPETDHPTLALIEVSAMEVYANVAVTQTLLDDSAYNIGSFVTDEIADQFNTEEGGAYLNGDGVSKPRGFLTHTITTEADAARAFGTLQYVPSGGAAGFAASNPGDALIDLAFKLRGKYRQNGRWLMNSATMATVSKFKDGQGNYLWSRSMAAGMPDLLLGYPVFTDEDMPDVAANTYPIAFGDWQRGYLITDRMGVRILRDPYTNKPFVMFYATKRVGGSIIDSNAIKLLKIAAS